MKNPKLFEINTRIWFARYENITKLSDVDFSYFDELKRKGIDYVWLMGVWKTCTSLIKKCCFSGDLLGSYVKALKDFNAKDVIGSPYAIDSYEVNPIFGGNEELLLFKEKLNKIGIKLILDFIPNHFGADSKFIQTNPEVFLQASEEQFKNDPYTYFKPENSDKIFCHGRDPFFPAWTDTIQVNYFNRKARSFMIEQLKNIMKYCDGVRCDMAMLPLNNVFKNTWIGAVSRIPERPVKEFWLEAISEIKEIDNEFLFMAEAYWDLEWDLQQLGFDFTYDKRLVDRLATGNIPEVKAHLTAEPEFMDRSVRFVENHDETRAVTKFGKFRSLMAATVISTIPGMKFYFDGQFEGKRIKLPVQLGREPQEKISKTVSAFYNNLLKITNDKIFREGIWELLTPIETEPGSISYENIFAWSWKRYNDFRLVAINYSEYTAACFIKFNTMSKEEQIDLLDLLSGEVYRRDVKDIHNNGLFIELKPYTAHIFRPLNIK